MKVWVIEVKNMLGERNGLRVFSDREDALEELNSLLTPEEYLENSDYVELITKHNDKFYVLEEINELADCHEQRAIAIECEVVEKTHNNNDDNILKEIFE